MNTDKIITENSPKLSIIIPHYNSLNCLIQKCNYFEGKSGDFEVVIVDDCSLEECWNKAIELTRAYNFQIKLVRTPQNSGPGAARNVGVREARGYYLTFLDVDDELADDYLNILFPLLNCDYDVIVHPMIMINSDGEKKLHRNSYIQMQNGMIDKKNAIVFLNGCTGGKVYKSELIKSNNIKFLQQKRYEDIPFAKCAFFEAEKIYYTNKLIYYYFQNDNSLTHTIEKNLLIDIKNAYEIIESKKYPYYDELVGIFLIEYLYSSIVYGFIILEYKDWKLYVDKIEQLYPDYKRNKYYKLLPLKYRLIIGMASRNEFIILKWIMKLK